jgi:sugar phosphate permease
MKPERSPRLFYGYFIVAACFAILFFVWGMVVNTFPVFLKPMTEAMNWGRGALSVALLMASIGTAVSAPLAGIAIDRMGARPVMAAGALMIGLGLLIGSRIAELWQLYVIFAVIGCGLMCASLIPCSLVISNWFVSRRGTALGLAFVGTACGGMVMSPLANWIILEYGWRTAFALSGALILAAALPLILLVIRTHPSEMGLEPYRDANSESSSGGDAWGVSLKAALSSRLFWQIAGIMLIVAVVTGGLGNHCVAYLTDLDHSPSSAAFAWSVVMAAMIAGKLSIGPIADRWGARNTTAGACVVLTVSILILTFAQPYWVALAFAAVYGFGLGAPLVLHPLLTGDYLGMKHFGAIYGALNIMGSVGAAIGPVGAGFYFDRWGSYLPVFYLFIGMMLAGAIVALSMKSVPPGEGAGVQ